MSANNDGKVLLWRIGDRWWRTLPFVWAAFLAAILSNLITSVIQYGYASLADPRQWLPFQELEQHPVTASALLIALMLSYIASFYAHRRYRQYLRSQERLEINRHAAEEKAQAETELARIDSETQAAGEKEPPDVQALFAEERATAERRLAEVDLRTQRVAQTFDWLTTSTKLWGNVRDLVDEGRIQQIKSWLADDDEMLSRLDDVLGKTKPRNWRGRIEVAGGIIGLLLTVVTIVNAISSAVAHH